MFQQRNRETASIFLIGDILGLTAAFFLAWWLRFELPIVPLRGDQPDFSRYIIGLPVILFVCLVALAVPVWAAITPPIRSMPSDIAA